MKERIYELDSRAVLILLEVERGRIIVSGTLQAATHGNHDREASFP